MEKIDTIIGVVGFVAIAATVLGVIFYEELAGEEDYKISLQTETLDNQQMVVNGAGTDFFFALPDNATEAHVTIQLSCTDGQALDPATVTLTGEAFGPDDNSTSGPTSTAPTIAAGTTCSGGNVGGPMTLHVAFHDAPKNFTSNPSDIGDSLTVDWGNKTLRVNVMASSTTQAPGIPGGVVGTFVFSADVGVEVTSYYAAKVVPEVESA